MAKNLFKLSQEIVICGSVVSDWTSYYESEEIALERWASNKAAMQIDAGEHSCESEKVKVLIDRDEFPVFKYVIQFTTKGFNDEPLSETWTLSLERHEFNDEAYLKLKESAR